jgi:hypothetical protein
VRDMPQLHTRLLADVIDLGSPYPLVLTGGYAVRAHRLVNRPSQDLDVATENPAPMADIAAALRAGLEARGWQVQSLETASLSARFTVTDGGGVQRVRLAPLESAHPLLHIRGRPLDAHRGVPRSAGGIRSSQPDRHDGCGSASLPSRASRIPIPQFARPRRVDEPHIPQRPGPVQASNATPLRPFSWRSAGPL